MINFSHAVVLQVQEQRSFLVPLPKVLGGLPLPKGTLAQLGSADVTNSGGLSLSSSSVASSVFTALSDALSLAFDQSANLLSAVRRSQPINEAQLNLPMQRVKTMIIHSFFQGASVC